MDAGTAEKFKEARKRIDSRITAKAATANAELHALAKTAHDAMERKAIAADMATKASFDQAFKEANMALKYHGFSGVDHSAECEAGIPPEGPSAGHLLYNCSARASNAPTMRFTAS